VGLAGLSAYRTQGGPIDFESALTREQLTALLIYYGNSFAVFGPFPLPPGTDKPTAVFEILLHRAPTDQERQAYFSAAGAQHNIGERDYILSTILGSTEYRQLLVQSFFQAYLRRPPDTGGLNYWVGRLQQGVSDEDVIAGFVSSPEYYNRAQG
jgi:hypothetical protein